MTHKHFAIIAPLSTANFHFRLILAIALCLIARDGIADLCAVRDLGLVPDSPDIDNGAILTAAIRAGKVNDTVHFPEGGGKDE